MDKRCTINYQSFEGTAKRLDYVHAPDLNPEIYLALEDSDRWFSDRINRTNFYFDLNGNSITLTKQAADKPGAHTLSVTLKSLDIGRLERLANDFGFPFDREKVIMPEN